MPNAMVAACGAALLLAVAVLAGCASKAPQPAPPPSTAAPLRVPANVVADLSRVARREGVTGDERVKMQEMELAPEGSRVVLAAGTREFCRDGNCPYGLYADEGGTYHPLLLAMASIAPKPQAVGRRGYPDISVTASDSLREMRITLFQWDGQIYRETSCRLVSTMTEASRGCVPTRAEDAPLVAGPPLRYCVTMAQMISHEAPPAYGRTALPDAFEIRSDAETRVEGVRMEGRVTDHEVDALVRCIRKAGTSLAPLKSARWSEGLASAGWAARSVPSRSGPVSVALTSTFIPSGDYTLLSLGVFQAARR